MTYADGAAERFLGEPGLERIQLALRTAAIEHAVVKRCNAGRVIATVLKAPERADQLAGDRLGP
jgi:hypothetical protein